MAAEPNPPVVLVDGSMQGTPTFGADGISRSVAEIQALQDYRDRNQLPRSPRRSIEHEVRRFPAANPMAPAIAQWPPAEPGLAAPAPSAPQVVGPPNFLAAALVDTGAFPPDTMGTVGPTQFIVAINGRIRSFTKADGLTDGALNVDTDVFFASVLSPGAGTFTTDPRIRFDRLSNRWYVLIIDVPGGSGALSNRVLLAVSNGATIGSASNFTFFQFQLSSTLFTDYPTLGIDNNALYIGANMFTLAGAFDSCAVAVVRKSSVIGAGPIVFTAFPAVAAGAGSGPYTPQGVDNYDPAATTGYFVGVDNATFGTLTLRRVSTPAATPTLSANIAVTVPTTNYPITVPHLGNTGGTNGNLDALDDRLYAAHLRNGRLWTAHNIQVGGTGVASSSGGRNGTRWYELQNLSGTPSVVQSGTVFDSAASTPLSYWIPSIMVSGQGHAALGFSVAGSNSRIDAATVGRLSGDAAGTTQGTPARYTTSSTAYNPPGDPGGTSGRRWGDYSYTSLDPCDDMTMWTVQEFASATNSYGVQAVRLRAPAPSAAACVSPTTINQGVGNVNLTLTGAGLYDTDASAAACRTRLAAAVSGSGVTVNSVTYNSATSVTLNLSVTAAATTGARTITLTNPDGQTAATSTCLSIGGGSSAVLAIDRSSANPTCTGSSVGWTVSLSAPVTGLSTANFALSGGTGAALTGISGSGASYTLSAGSGSAATVLGVSMLNNVGVTPAVTGLPFTGQSYTVNARPQVNGQTPTAICSGAATSIALTSTPSGATYTWTASNSAGSVTGFAGGSGGTIAQTLTGAGQVSYAVSASLASCASSAPTTIVQGVSNPSVTTAAVPDGTLGIAYSQSLAATGTLGTAVFDLSAGTLPAGLGLSAAGLLSGTPSVSGTFNFSARASDSGANCSGTRAYTLLIRASAIFADGFE